MAWHMTGQLHELCSCQLWCPCYWGQKLPRIRGGAAGRFCSRLHRVPRKASTQWL